MKIVLSEHVDHLGERGEIVSVAPGYARNYLLPKRLAKLATPGNMRVLQQERRVWEVKESKAVEQAQAMAKRLAAVDLGVTKKAGESGTLYGSVTSAEIAELLEAKGIQVDRRKLVLNAPIKSVGTHEIAIRLHRKVKATITVVVLSDRVHEPLAESDDAPQDDEPDYDRDSE